MTSTTASLATPSAPDARRSLVLGLLSIPGSTVAWDLPAGGLWIGLPLAVAAIFFGARARRERTGGRSAVVGIALASLAILQMAVWILASVIS